MSPRRFVRLSTLAAIFIGAFAVTAAALVLGIGGTDAGAAPEAAVPPAAAATTDPHVGRPHPAAADGVTEPAAPRNTNPATVPSYRPAAVQRIHLDMTEKVVEIAPGKVVKVWTFGDRVPGPVLRVRVGDVVEATIVNRTTMPHSIDFHAARIAPNVAFRDVAPGESFTFRFTASSPGVFMYHCGTAPVVHHIANGMYGMIIVEPEGGLPPVDRELGFVQSEFYVSDTPGSRRTT